MDASSILASIFNKTAREKDTICFDFDGVIHRFKSGWKGVDVIPDGPVDGIKEAIESLRKDYEVVVYSSRCSEEKGVKAIEKFLKDNGIVVDRVATSKPPAKVYVDDRAVCFDGNPTKLVSDIKGFVPWTDSKTDYSNKRRQREDGKIPLIEESNLCPIGKQVATMLATSHEYSVPKAAEAIKLVSHYDWEVSETPIDNLQGINKPVNFAKVDRMTEAFKSKSSLKPLIVVNKLIGIMPQSRGKYILLDGHHRKLAYKEAGHGVTPIYLGKFKELKGDSRERLIQETRS